MDSQQKQDPAPLQQTKRALAPAGPLRPRFQLALQRVLHGPVVEEVGAEVQGVPTHDDLDELLLAVEHSEAVMLIQTASVLYRPWTLLQLYTALCLSKPIICLHVDQGGYDHFAMRQLLENMRQQLDEFSPGAFEVRSTHPAA